MNHLATIIFDLKIIDVLFMLRKNALDYALVNLNKIFRE